MQAYEQYDWQQLNHLFWSETSSSYMLHNIFERHKEIARVFLKKVLGLGRVNFSSQLDNHHRLP